MVVFHTRWGKEGIRAVLVDKDRKQHLGWQTRRGEVVVRFVPLIISKEVDAFLGFTGRGYGGEGQVALPLPACMGGGLRKTVHLRAGLRVLLSARCWPFPGRAALGGRLTVWKRDQVGSCGIMCDAVPGHFCLQNLGRKHLQRRLDLSNWSPVCSTALCVALGESRRSAFPEVHLKSKL